MNLKQLTAFNELMLTGSVSEAARNLNRTQPTVSHQIASLEDSLGIRLFERRKGRLHPVPEAQYLFEESSYLLRRLGGVSQNMRRLKTMTRGELRMASMPGPSVFLLPDLISRQIGQNSEVKCTLLSRSSEAVLQLVSSQQFDLGLADYDPAAESQSALVDIRVFRFKCLCAIPKSDPLAGRRTVTAKDFDGKPMALLFAEHQSHRAVAEAFSSVGCTLNVRFVTQYFIPQITYVEHQLAYSILDPLTAAAYRLYREGQEKVSFVDFEPAVEYSVALLSPKYRPGSLLAATFSEVIAEELVKNGGEEVGVGQG